MPLITILVGILIALVFIVMVLFILFGQITVRKLRKNPETKDELGFEYVSGWDIINVAQALAMPKAIIRKFKSTPLSALYADVDLLHKNTNRFDQVLAAVFYWIFIFTGIFGALLVILNALGIFD